MIAARVRPEDTGGGRGRRTVRLLDRLPAVRGRYRALAPLAPRTWFRTGGPAEVEYRPADREDLARFLAERPDGVPVTVIGAGSNLLVRDGGVPGVVIRLGAAFAAIRIAGDRVHAGAAALDRNVALAARRAGLAGLEFLSGIPGSIGGGLRMNAGAYGGEFKAALIAVRALDGSGRPQAVAAEALGLGYRHCAAPADWLFLDATFRASPDDPTAIGRRMEAIADARTQSQPLGSRTGGSTFANPEGASPETGKAWMLIEQAGCRGLRIGGAMVSDRHCNFLINTGDAGADDLEALGEEVRRRVLDATGIRLRWEIRRIGVPAGHPEALTGEDRP